MPEPTYEEQVKTIRTKLDEPTPYMLAIRKEWNQAASEAKRKALWNLTWLELLEPKTPLGAWRAVILSHTAGLPVPQWAAEMFMNIFGGYIRGEICDLGIAFGLRGEQGKTAELRRRLLERRDEELCLHIRMLILSGKRVGEACLKVAKRIARTPASELNETFYTLIPQEIKPQTFAKTLVKIYSKWEATKKDRDLLAPIDTDLTTLLEKHKDMCLGFYADD